MLRLFPSGLRVALVVVLAPVVLFFGCSDDGESSSPGGGGAGGAGDAGGAEPGGDGSTSEGAEGGRAGHESSPGAANGGAPGGEAGAEGVAGAPGAGAPALGGAGGDANEGEPFIGSGPYAIAYTSLPGTDRSSRSSVTATFAETRELTGFVYSSSESPTIGSNAASEVYMDAISALGRWSGGTTGGSYNASTLTWTANQGLHYAIGIPTPFDSLPASGSTSYTLLAATHPTIHPNDVSPGMVTAGSAEVSWGEPVSTISLTLSVTTSAGDYSIAASGLATNAVQKDFWTGTAPATGTGPACGGDNCQGRFQGFIVGPEGERLGFEFLITSGGTAYTVRGAVLFGAL